MEFRDLKKQYELYKSEIDQEINRVLTAGTFIGGEPVSELEKQLAQYVGRKFCVSCASIIYIFWKMEHKDLEVNLEIVEHAAWGISRQHHFSRQNPWGVMGTEEPSLLTMKSGKQEFHL